MFRKWFREQGFVRDPVDGETRDAILDAERERVEAWAKAENLEERGIGVDAGCNGTSMAGVELTLPLRALVATTILISEKRRSDHVLDALFDDLTLSGSLYTVMITPDDVKLRFAPRRATEVYDVALRRVGELLTQAKTPPPKNSQDGPYR